LLPREAGMRFGKTAFDELTPLNLNCLK